MLIRKFTIKTLFLIFSLYIVNCTFYISTVHATANEWDIKKNASNNLEFNWNSSATSGLTLTTTSQLQLSNGKFNLFYDGFNSILSSTSAGGDIVAQPVSNGSLRPYADNAYDLGTTALRWRSLRVGLNDSSFDGKLGVGTASPKFKLDIRGPAAFAGNSANLDPASGISLTPLQNSGQLLVGWNRTAGGGETDFIGNRSAGSVGGFRFYDYSNTGALSELLTIRGDGTVGIGTVNPYTTFTVTSNTNTSAITAQSQTSYDIFSVLPWTGRTYLGSGVYFKNSQWYVQSWNGSGGLLGIGQYGGEWLAFTGGTNGSAMASWNAANTTLWTQNGTLQGASSRTFKENFQDLDSKDILNKIDKLDITRWNYKNEQPEITHIGPTAEQFNQLFKTGTDEKYISLVDGEGVALAGVKALIEENKNLEKRVSELEEKINLLLYK